MKTKIAILSTIFMLLVSFTTKADNKKDKKDQVTFDVSMTCENCKKRIEKNIAFEKGVTDMKVDLPNKTVFIEYKDGKTDIEKLQKAIEKLGYTVSVHKVTEKTNNK